MPVLDTQIYADITCLYKLLYASESPSFNTDVMLRKCDNLLMYNCIISKTSGSARLIMQRFFSQDL